MKERNAARVIVLVFVFLGLLLTVLVFADQRISRLDAMRCLVDLKNDGELAKGITLGERIEEGDPNRFATDPRGGRFHFVLWKDKVRLMELMPPPNFPIAEPGKSTPGVACSKFLRCNFPEGEWKKEKSEEIENYASYTCVAQNIEIEKDTKLKMRIVIWLPINRIVEVKHWPVEASNSS